MPGIIIEGTVVEVMESWPLQLSVESGGRIFQVRLLEETEAAHRGKMIDHHRLKPNCFVRIVGECPPSDEHTLTALSIDLLD